MGRKRIITLFSVAIAMSLFAYLATTRSDRTAQRILLDLSDESTMVDASGQQQPARGEHKHRHRLRTQLDVSLPALEVPFDQSFAQLKQRADAGEPAAACRLAAELERCSALMTRLTSVDAATRGRKEIQEKLAAGNSEQKAIATSMQEAARAEVAALAVESEHCGQAPLLDPIARASYWRTAALGGHLPAMRHYAVGNAFQWRELLNALPAVALYRSEGEQIARHAAAAGDTATILALAAAYSPRDADSRGQFLAQIVDEDAAESVSLYQLLREGVGATPSEYRPGVVRELDRIIQNLQSTMGPAEIARSERLLLSRKEEWTTPNITPSVMRSNWEGGTTLPITATDCAPATLARSLQ